MKIPRLGNLFILYICSLVILISARPSIRQLSSHAPRRITSTKYGRSLTNKMRLGIDKKGIVEDWTIVSQHDIGGLRLREPAEIRYVSPRPQLSGSMGVPGAPGRIKHSKQFQPAKYSSPDPSLRDQPGGLKILTKKERETVAREFFFDFNYTTANGLADMTFLVKEMQKNYGMNQTGILDDATLKAMLEPRCGVPDGPAAYRTFANREHWQNKDVTYMIKGYTPDMSQCQARNAFKRAFRVWEEVTDLTFIESDSEDADIIIYFGYKEHGDGYAFDGANGLLAHAFTPGTEPISGDSHFDEGEFWTLGNGKVFDTYNGNSGGKPCAFPFYFEDKTYTACTSAGRSDGMEWCATTADYDRDAQWAFCPQETLFTYGGNADNDPCVFPFDFLGKTYDKCTYEGRSDGYEWCATTSNYDTDARWGFCPGRAHGTQDGNAGGASCKFPFIFQSHEYNDCTTQGRSDYKLWCGTTENYDNDKLWGFCAGSGYSLFLVAAHEFGHAIGLDHSDVPGALMYPVYSYKSEFILPDDDQRGARDLYGGPRRRALPILELERCGGDLTETETGITPRPTSQPISTSTSSTTTRGGTGGCAITSKPTDICDHPIDAVMRWQNEIWIFQGMWVWRLLGKGKQLQKSVYTIRQYWPGPECNVDAAYQRPSDGKILIFKGSQYWVYSDTTILAGYPRDVRELGLPRRTVVDAVAYLWLRKSEGRTYYFVGSTVYRADDVTSVVMAGYDSELNASPAWIDLPNSVDAVFPQAVDKPYTIFLKGDNAYRYNNRDGELDYERKMERLFKCSRKNKGIALPLTSRD